EICPLADADRLAERFLVSHESDFVDELGKHSFGKAALDHFVDVKTVGECAPQNRGAAENGHSLLNLTGSFFVIELGSHFPSPSCVTKTCVTCQEDVKAGVPWGSFPESWGQ